jgi:hypothetical protein
MTFYICKRRDPWHAVQEVFLGFTTALYSESDGGVSLKCIDAYAVLE